jgi:NOL1/NOP2/sun family putative RNA methylase
MNILESFQKYKTIIPDFNQFEASLLEISPVYIRANQIKISCSELEKKLADKGINFQRVEHFPGVYQIESENSIGDYLFHHLGYFYIQNLSSLLPPLALNVTKSDKVIDLCAAPGGKTCYLAELMENNGVLVANELSSNRMRALKGNLSRLGIMNTLTVNYRAQDFPMQHKFNKILLDGPCSAEGTYRGKDRLEVYWKNDEGFKKGLYGTQRKIILRAFDLLADGGEMVYSTCTYNPHENEGCVQYLLNNREGVKIEPLDLPFNLSSGITEYEGESFHPDMKNAMRVYPHQMNTGGFFLVKISKTS